MPPVSNHFELRCSLPKSKTFSTVFRAWVANSTKFVVLLIDTAGELLSEINALEAGSQRLGHAEFHSGSWRKEVLYLKRGDWPDPS